MGLTSKQRGRTLFAGGAEIGARTYTADGPIAATTHVALLSKAASAGVHTLVAPTRDGIHLILVARTAFAHQVTATGLVDDGVTGGSKNTITMAAFPGSTAEFISAGGKWNTLGLKGATVP